MPGDVPCPDCNRKGLPAPTPPCWTCGGDGWISEQEADELYEQDAAERELDRRLEEEHRG